MKRKRENDENVLNEKKKRKIEHNNLTDEEIEEIRLKTRLKDLTERIEKYNDIELYFLRGRTFQEMKKNKLALDDFNMAIKVDPKNADGYFYRGEFYYVQKQYNLALWDLSQAVKLDSKHVDSFLKRANLYERLEQYDLALQDYSQVIKVDSTNSQSFFRRGNLYKNLEQYDLALQDYSQGIKLEPSLFYYNIRGNLYKKLKQNDLAFQDYYQAIKVGRNYEEIILSNEYTIMFQQINKIVSELRRGNLYESHINLSMLYNELNNHLMSIKHEANAKEYLEDEDLFLIEYSGRSRRDRVEKLKKKIFMKNISKW